MNHMAKLVRVALAVLLLGINPASVAAARSVVHPTSYILKWPQVYADSPCSQKNLSWWIKNVAETPYKYSFYSDQAFCALPLSEVSLAQQYNTSHNTHVAFYTNKTFYRRYQQQAYAHIRALRRARPAHWSACDIIGWASDHRRAVPSG
jgi:hypothetical protein